MSFDRLKLKTDTTQFIWLGSRQQLLKVEIDSIQLGSGSVPLKSSVNNLGVIFDSQLSMLRVVRGSLTFEASVQLVHAFINSRLDYCNSLLAGVSDQWSVSFSQFYKRPHGWFSSRRSTTTSPITFETNYTGFRFGSEFRLNFVYSFSAACVVKLLHTSRRCSLSFQAAMCCGLIARRLVAISLFHGRSPRPSALVGMRSLGRPHGTHSQHTWKIKICLPLFLDLNSKLTFFSSQVSYMFFQHCCFTDSSIYFGLVHFCWQATRHSRNGYWSVRERLQMIFRIVSYRIVLSSTLLSPLSSPSSSPLSSPSPYSHCY